MSTPLTVSLVEDEAGIREALTLRINRAPGLRCLCAYSTGEQAVRGLQEKVPDVALIDINLPGMSGIECVARLRTLTPQLPVLMLTTYEDRESIFSALRAGAKGYLLKNMPAAELIQAIEALHAGGAPMSMPIARKVVDFFEHTAQPVPEVENLTRREREILRLLAQGYLYKEIGDQLGISVNTVRMHLKHIYEKLHVQSRTEATAKYLTQLPPHMNM